MFKYLLTCMTLSLCFLTQSAHQFQSEIDSAKGSPRMKQAFEADFLTKKRSVEQINQLLSAIQERSESMDVASFETKLRKRLSEEQSVLDLASAIFTPLSAGKQITHSLNSNKMQLAVNDILTNLLSQKNLSTLFRGHHVFDIDITTSSIPSLLGQRFWGTTQAPRYQLLLTAVLAELMNLDGKSPVTGVEALLEATTPVDTNPLTHVVPLPSNLSNWDDYLEKSLFFNERLSLWETWFFHDAFRVFIWWSQEHR